MLPIMPQANQQLQALQSLTVRSQERCKYGYMACISDAMMACLMFWVQHMKFIPSLACNNVLAKVWLSFLWRSVLHGTWQLVWVCWSLEQSPAAAKTDQLMYCNTRYFQHCLYYMIPIMMQAATHIALWFYILFRWWFVTWQTTQESCK